MPVRKIKEFLDSHNVRYTSVSHSVAYTAQEIAASTHIPGKELAKCVIVKADGKMLMAVIPASYRIDFGHLGKALGAGKAELATEEEFKDRFPGCEVGAMPPFGNLFDMEVMVAESLAEDEDIAFNAGTHREVVRMKYKDFEKLVKPKVARFSYKPTD